MPAVSGSPTQLAASVLDPQDLAGLPDDAFAEGDLACVRSLWPQSTFRLRRAVLPVAANNVTAIDAFSGNGYWELFPQGGSMLSFPDIASLAAFDDQNLGSGALVYVVSVRSYWSKLVEADPGTADAITIVRNPGNTATWYRDDVPSPSWGEVATWGLAATTGSDENEGTPAAPLQTFAEFARRVQQISSSVTLQILEDTIEHFYGYFDGVGSAASLSITGIPTVIASSILNTVFVDPITAPVANVSMGTVAATGLDFSTATGALGTFVRSGARVAPVLGNTGATGYVPFFSDAVGDLTKPVDGDPIEVITPRSISSMQIVVSNVRTSISYLKLDINNVLYTNGVASPSQDFEVDYFACMNTGLLATYGETTLRAHLANVSTFIYTNAVAYLVGGGSRRAGTNTAYGIGTVSFKGFISNNGTISTSTITARNCYHFVAPYGLGVFNSAGAGVNLPAGLCWVAGSPLYGRGNATYGLDLALGASAKFDAGYTPAITGTLSDFRFNGSITTAIPPLAAGLVVPAAQSIAGVNGAGWAKWDGSSGGFFNRKLMDYNNGTTLVAG